MEWLLKFLGLDRLIDERLETLSRQIDHVVGRMADYHGRISMFSAQQVKVFGGGVDISAEFRARDGRLEGTFVDGRVTIFAQQLTDKLSNDNGILYFVPMPVVELVPFAFGGFGPRAVGIARMRNRQGTYALGTAYWLGPNQNPTGHDAIVVEVDGRPIQNGHPWDWHNGLQVELQIDIP